MAVSSGFLGRHAALGDAFYMAIAAYCEVIQGISFCSLESTDLKWSRALGDKKDAKIKSQVNEGPIACTPTSLILSATDSSAFVLIGSLQPGFPMHKPPVDRNEWIHTNDIHLI